MRKPRISIWIELPLLAWLVFLWGALWQDFSAGNLIFGLLIALLIPPAPRLLRMRVKPSLMVDWTAAAEEFSATWFAVLPAVKALGKTVPAAVVVMTAAAGEFGETVKVGTMTP